MSCGRMSLGVWVVSSFFGFFPSLPKRGTYFGISTVSTGSPLASSTRETQFPHFFVESSFIILGTIANSVKNICNLAAKFKRWCSVPNGMPSTRYMLVQEWSHGSRGSLWYFIGPWDTLEQIPLTIFGIGFSFLLFQSIMATIG